MDSDFVLVNVEKLLSVVEDLLENLSVHSSISDLRILLELSHFNLEQIKNDLTPIRKNSEESSKGYAHGNHDVKNEFKDGPPVEEGEIDDEMEEGFIGAVEYQEEDKTNEASRKEENLSVASPVMINITSKSKDSEESLPPAIEFHEYQSNGGVENDKDCKPAPVEIRITAEDKTMLDFSIEPQKGSLFHGFYIEYESPNWSLFNKYCSICDHTFTKRNSLKQHIYDKHRKTEAEIEAEMRHHCPVCNKGFRRRSVMTAHIKKEHPKSCTKCDVTYRSRKEYLEHWSKHHGPVVTDEKGTVTLGGEDQLCPLCDATFSTEEFLDHLDPDHFVNGQFECSFANGYVCKFTSLDREQFSMHLVVQHCFQSYLKCHKCMQSDLFFTKEIALKRHLNSVHDAILNPYGSGTCVICGVKKEKRHMDSHSHMKFKCQICYKDFHNGELLRSHLKHLHLKPRLDKCEVCGADVRGGTGALKIHMERHSASEKTVPCTKCEMKFYSERHRRVHENRVHVERNYICAVCSQGCKTKQRLKVHMSRHLTERIVPCSKCDLKFKTEAQQRAHYTRQHTDKKNKNCRFCGKMFKQSNLKVHEMLHTGDIAVKCHICDKGFVQKGNYRLHMRTTHGQNM